MAQKALADTCTANRPHLIVAHLEMEMLDIEHGVAAPVPPENRLKAEPHDRSVRGRWNYAAFGTARQRRQATDVPMAYQVWRLDSFGQK